MKVLKNDKCIIEYSEDKKDFFGRDLTDVYNLPAFFNKTKRSHKKAWQALEERFDENTTMYQCMGILEHNSIKCHSWCMMD